MTQREWKCEECEVAGCVEAAKSFRVADLIEAIQADHADRSPDCAANFCDLAYFPEILLFKG